MEQKAVKDTLIGISTQKVDNIFDVLLPVIPFRKLLLEGLEVEQRSQFEVFFRSWL
jgi:hypothetical protein